MRIIRTIDDTGSLWCPDELQCNHDEERLIIKLHDSIYGNDWYCTDSLSYRQVLFIMFDELPFSWFIKLFLDTVVIRWEK